MVFNKARRKPIQKWSIKIVAGSHSHNNQQAMFCFMLSTKKKLWERHFAAIFEHFESVFNPPQRLADKSAAGGLDAFLR
jgi:hypothetical protein